MLKKEKALASNRKCFLHVETWTCLGLNQGPPDYEYLKVIFYDISLF